MPREIVHWDVLHSAMAQLAGRNAEVVDICLHKFNAVARLGAVVHDAPYYADWGKDLHFTAYAEYLHGLHSEDTFLPLKKLAMSIVEMKDARQRFVCWALLLGMVSHYVADVNFHPVVYYFTGNYNDEDIKKRARAQTLHRLFEVYMDAWFRRRAGVTGDLFVGSLIRQIGVDLEPICALLAEISIEDLSGNDLNPDEYKTKASRESAWQKSIKCLAFCQRAFYNHPLGALVRLFSRLTGRIKDVDVLFSFNRQCDLKLFSSPISYKNPVTGIGDSVSVTELRDKSAAETAELFIKFEPLLSQAEASVDKALGGVVGKSLNYGKSAVSGADMKYMAEKLEPFLAGVFDE